MNTFLFLTLLAIIAVPAMVQESDITDSQSDGPFVHTVYFWLENDSEEDRQQLLDGLNMIKDIEHVQKGYIGVPASTSRGVIDNSYDFSITFIFENKEEEQAYQTHPTHLKFVEENEQLWKRVVVYDAVPPANH